MTHTLETTAISRVVARALRLNEDLVEAIGLGHDTGHTPFGHAGEQALDEALRDRFGTGFRHNEQSHRIAERLNLTLEVRDGILTHTGAQEPVTLEGKIVRIVDRIAYVNHDIDDALRYGLLSEGDLPQDEIALLGATGSSRIDTLVHDLVESSEAAGDIAQGDEVGDAMLSLRAFMFERVYLGPQVKPEHRRAERVVRTIFERLCDEPREASARRGRARGADHRLCGRDDRPLRAHVRREPRVVARIKDASVDAVKAAADIVEVVSLRTSLRRVSGARFSGRCPFHEERTPSFSVDPVGKLYYCFGCGKGGDVIRFVQESENLDFAGAIEWLAERFRITLEYEESSPREDEQRRRRDRLTKLLDQATTYFERVLWDTEAGEPVRAYLAERGLGDEVAREFRLGLSRGTGLVAKARESGFTPDEIRSAGLANQRGNDYFPFRLMFPLADARGRIVGFQARKLRDDDPLRGKYVNTPESDVFKKGSVLYGLHLARPAIAKQDRAIVVEGNTDVIALRQAGVEPVVASMGTALTEHQLRELGRLTKRLFLCFDADAAGQEATLRGMQLAVKQGFDVRVVALPKGEDPADAPDSFAGRLGAAESYLYYRVRIVLERTDDRQEAFVRVREILAEAEDSPERQEALRLLADRLDLPRETLAGLAPSRSGPSSSGSPRPEETTPRLLEAGLQRERELLAAVVRNPTLLDELAALTPDHFDDPLHRRFREYLRDGWCRGRRAGRAPRRARRAGRARRARRANRARARVAAPRAQAPARPAGCRPRTGDGAPGAAREDPLGAPRARINSTDGRRPRHWWDARLRGRRDPGLRRGLARGLGAPRVRAVDARRHRAARRRLGPRDPRGDGSGRVPPRELLRAVALEHRAAPSPGRDDRRGRGRRVGLATARRRDCAAA